MPGWLMLVPSVIALIADLRLRYGSGPGGPSR
jgi:hypothetical protein